MSKLLTPPLPLTSSMRAWSPECASGAGRLATAAHPMLAWLGRLLSGLLLIAAVLGASVAHAQAPGKRVALLIGNNNYPSAPLVNAVNDARDLSDALKELGFKTIVRENATRQDIAGALRDFARELEGAEAGLFFYAGHAMQFKDRNFLIPVDADMKSEEDVTFSSVELGQVFDRMERARTRFNFIVLDACRDNPFGSTFKVSSSGLAQISNAPSGTLVAYATAPGSVAADGYGRNGVYTKHILQQVKVPDLPVEIMFKRVREAVERETRRLQTPWDVSSLKGDFAFNPAGKAASVAPSNGPSSDAQLAIEREFWVSVRDSARAGDIQAYLDKYPSGQYVVLARNRIETLTRPQGKPAEPAQVVSAVSPESRPAAAPATSAGATATGQPASAPASAAPGAASADAKPASPAGAQPRKDTPAPAKPVETKLGENKPAETKLAVSNPAETKPTASGPAGAAGTAGTGGAGGTGGTSPATATASAATQAPAAPAPQVALAAPTAAKPPVDTAPGREISPGVREVTYEDGSIYRGGLRGTRLHGSGEYVSKTGGFKYTGEYQDGNMHGKGNLTFGSGDNYEGEFADNKPHGKGVYKFANGDSYIGEMKAGSLTGRGLFTTRDGDTIDGQFSDGKASGKGIYKFASGDRYEGELVQGQLTGKGIYYAASGDRIEGNFVNGRPEGGIYHFANGDRYQGEMQGGTLTGRGAYFHKNGSKYEGEMVSGRPQGKGTFWFVDGARFEGNFADGLKKASGAYIDKDGKRQDAEMVDGEVKFK